MKYVEITLNKKSRDEIQKRLTAIVSSGMFTFSNVCSKKPIRTDVRFRGVGYWKKAKVLTCEQKNDDIRKLIPNLPKETCLIRIIHQDCPFGEGGRDSCFMENDIFYFYGKNVRVRPQKKTFDNKFQLFKLSHSCKHPYTKQVLQGWEKSDSVRKDMFFFQASVENEWV